MEHTRSPYSRRNSWGLGFGSFRRGCPVFAEESARFAIYFGCQSRRGFWGCLCDSGIKCWDGAQSSCQHWGGDRIEPDKRLFGDRVCLYWGHDGNRRNTAAFSRKEAVIRGHNTCWSGLVFPFRIRNGVAAIFW